MTTQEKAAELRAQAAECLDRKEESFDRCDTDGFLSQWASGLTASKHLLEAELVEAGGVWEFPALFDLDGNRVPAKLISVADKFRGGTRSVWMVVDEATGKAKAWVNPSTGGKRSIANLRDKGYVEGYEMAPGRVELVGTDRCNVCPVVVRDDKGWR